MYVNSSYKTESGVEDKNGGGQEKVGYIERGAMHHQGEEREMPRCNSGCASGRDK